jgi:hypothetical protein
MNLPTNELKMICDKLAEAKDNEAHAYRMLATLLETAPQTNVVQHPATPAQQTAPPATAAPVAEAPAEAPAQTVASGGPTATVDEVVALFQELEQTHGKLDMAPLFQELGIERVSAATAEQRGALVAAMKQKWRG